MDLGAELLGKRVSEAFYRRYTQKLLWIFELGNIKLFPLNKSCDHYPVTENDACMIFYSAIYQGLEC